MSITTDKGEKLNVHLKGEVADKFKRIKGYLGLEQDTEVIRTLVTWYFAQHEKELSGPPKNLWHFNLNDNGVVIWDPFLHWGVQIFFTPKGIPCSIDETDDCRHIQFALCQPDI